LKLEQFWIAKERVIQAVRDLRLAHNGYIWVTNIVNYEGGDNYAIRLVHPNLPDTEGDWLSTKTEDFQGDQPYKTELEGVKENGHIFFDYYFKKMDSAKISYKMSYSKLYTPFDWIIGTGIYIDDVDQLIAEETARMRSTYETQKTRSITITVLAVLGSLLIMVFF
jgi:signal transduction histidine kinase